MKKEKVTKNQVKYGNSGSGAMLYWPQTDLNQTFGEFPEEIVVEIWSLK